MNLLVLILSVLLIEPSFFPSLSDFLWFPSSQSIQQLHSHPITVPWVFLSLFISPFCRDESQLSRFDFPWIRHFVLDQLANLLVSLLKSSQDTTDKATNPRKEPTSLETIECFTSQIQEEARLLFNGKSNIFKRNLGITGEIKSKGETNKKLALFPIYLQWERMGRDSHWEKEETRMMKFSWELL